MKLKNCHSFLPDCIRSTMSSCRWWDAIVGEIYIYIYASPSQSPFPRLKHDIPYQRRNHSQDWQVRCRIGRHEEKAEWPGMGWCSGDSGACSRGGVIAQKWSAPVFERRVSV